MGSSYKLRDQLGIDGMIRTVFVVNEIPRHYYSGVLNEEASHCTSNALPNILFSWASEHRKEPWGPWSWVAFLRPELYCVFV